MSIIANLAVWLLALFGLMSLVGGGFFLYVMAQEVEKDMEQPREVTEF